MNAKKKRLSIWSIMGFIGFIFLLTGIVNGGRELFNQKTVYLSLTEYMKTNLGGSTPELTDCKIEDDVSVKVTKRRKPKMANSGAEVGK